MKMKKFLSLLLAAFICATSALAATDDAYDVRQAKRNIQEAEYHIRRGESYRREADSYLKRAESYQREAANYTRRGDARRADDYYRKADRAMTDYAQKKRSANEADAKAADYLQKASMLLRH